MQATVRAMVSLEEMKQLVELQERIWGYGGDRFDHPYPARALFSLAQSGGLVAGVELQGRVVGFAVAWLGRTGAGKLYLHSQLVGVLPEFRELGLGYRLKLFQRGYALENGLDLIRWTFDPLQSANAYLNLAKLGGIVRNYAVNYYGDTESRLNQGVPTDRVWVDWLIDTDHVRRFLDGRRNPPAPSAFPSVTRCSFRKTGGTALLELIGYDLNRPEPDLVVEIPDHFDRLRARHLQLARRWRGQLREILTHYLEDGYVLVDLLVESRAGERRIYYHLSRDL